MRFWLAALGTTCVGCSLVSLGVVLWRTPFDAALVPQLSGVVGVLAIAVFVAMATCANVQKKP